MHSATEQQVTSLIHTSADDARSSLACMLINSGAAETLKICTEALIRLDVLQAAKKSHRKAFAATARQALKELEKGGQS